MSMWDWAIFDELRRMNARQMVYQVLNFAMIVSSALMIWKGLMVIIFNFGIFYANFLGSKWF